MPFAAANGIELYYELSGTGERLLLISGTGADLSRGPRLTDGDIFEPFELLQYDQRGLGQSAVPEGPYSMADYADDAGALLDALDWDETLVVGVSFGGMVAQEFAIRHPARVRRLVLACTSSGGAGGASYPLQDLVGLPPEEAVARRMECLDTRWDAAWRATHPDVVKMISDAFNLGGESDEAAKGALLQLDARSRHDTSRRLGEIRCPTLVCGGRYDGIAPPPNSEFLSRSIPGAQLRMFDGGHAFFMQDSAAFPAIVAFLRGEVPEPAPA
jgi:3-oxoadipate enol-lactonase